MSARRAARGRLWDTVRTVEDLQGGSAENPPRSRATIARQHAVGNLLAALARDPLKDSPGRERKNHSTIKVELIAEHGSHCMACPVTMPSESLVHLHHVVPVSDGGPDTRENCLLLCPNCHAIAHWRYRKLAKDSRPTTPGQLLAMLRQAA